VSSRVAEYRMLFGGNATNYKKARVWGKQINFRMRRENSYQKERNKKAHDSANDCSAIIGGRGVGN